ncbi:MAG: hypothetical protein GWN00_06335 [Aliifodinibius sp.]|nr:hypothetical protein [Fodinibius sp.]NIV10840.1 hypothetical protein [Fodinibius sp.]NIY24437.1 hypothetical protein [Fodinibius sp.]
MATTAIVYDISGSSPSAQTLTGGHNFRFQIANSLTTGDGATAISIQFVNASTSDAFHIGRAAIGIESTTTGSDYTGPPTDITFNTGDATVTISTAGSVWSDYITFSWSTSVHYLIHIKTETTNEGLSYISAVASYGAYKQTTIDETTVIDTTGYLNLARVYLVQQIKAETSSVGGGTTGNLFFAHG